MSDCNAKSIRYQNAMCYPKVVITDSVDIHVEREMLELVGAGVVALQGKRQEELFDAARGNARHMINQCVRIGEQTISKMQRCEVVTRYGAGVDVVDVDPATRKGILVC